MLRRLTASDPRFRTVHFKPGLNILIARSTEHSAATDSRNGLGKSAMIELVHFLLGSKADRTSLPCSPALRDWTFSLELDWPGGSGELAVRRSGAKPLDVVTVDEGLGRSLPLKNADWQTQIESALFGLRGKQPGLSGRMMLSFLIRRASSHGFNSPVRSFDRQRDVEATPNLAYLLGLDAGLAEKYKELADRKLARQELRKAAADPALLGSVVGTLGDLQGELSVVNADLERLRAQCAEFHVVPQYEALQARADEINRFLQQSINRDFAERRNLEALERAITEAVDPEVKYLRRVYDDLGIALPGDVERRFDEVREFHAAVVRNRRVYLEQELSATRLSMREREQQRAELGRELSEIMKELESGGALEGMQNLQNALARRLADQEQLQRRLKIAKSMQASAQEIKAAEADLQRQASQDLAERWHQVEEANRLFLDLVRRMYGQAHKGYLFIEPTSSSLKITPKIDSDDSTGINHVSIFCFDMTLAVLAHRGGRGPDFLVHDSHLFDGVDERQLKHALEAAVALTEQERLQYIVTLNEDDLDKAVDLGFDPEPYIIEPRLTDADPTGGLFGFRFERR